MYIYTYYIYIRPRAKPLVIRIINKQSPRTAGISPGKPKQQATGDSFRVPETGFSSPGVLGDSEVCGVIWLCCAALLLLLCWKLLRGNAPAENHAPKSGAPLGLPEGERIS